MAVNHVETTRVAVEPDRGRTVAVVAAVAAGGADVDDVGPAVHHVVIGGQGEADLVVEREVDSLELGALDQAHLVHGDVVGVGDKDIVAVHGEDVQVGHLAAVGHLVPRVDSVDLDLVEGRAVAAVALALEDVVEMIAEVVEAKVEELKKDMMKIDEKMKSMEEKMSSFSSEPAADKTVPAIKFSKAGDTKEDKRYNMMLKRMSNK